jgi:hypothetical protein
VHKEKKKSCIELSNLHPIPYTKNAQQGQRKAKPKVAVMLVFGYEGKRNTIQC